MGVAEAVVAAGWLACEDILGVHYDTFPLIAIDHEEAKEAFLKNDRRLHLLKPGEEWQF